MKRYFLCALLASAVGIVACSSDESSSGSGAAAGTCEAAADAICKKACDCGEGGKCSIVTPSGDAGGGSAASFDNLDGCLAFYKQLGCAQQNANIDWGACETAAKGATCGEASGKKGMVSVPECNKK